MFFALLKKGTNRAKLLPQSDGYKYSSKTGWSERESAQHTVPRLVNVSNKPWTMETTMINFIKNFRKDEDGAVTIDWVVLTAAIVALAIAAMGAIEGNTTALITTAGTAVGAE